MLHQSNLLQERIWIWYVGKQKPSEKTGTYIQKLLIVLFFSAESLSGLKTKVPEAILRECR